MKKILLIHTVLPTAITAIAHGDRLIEALSNEDQKDHGRFLHAAIDALLEKTLLGVPDIDAIAVTTGPGSYTGIRVGLSAAKGLAFAAEKPVIAVSTLELLAASAIGSFQKQGTYMPLIHARHTEYFAGWYHQDGRAIRPDAVIDLHHYLNNVDENDPSPVYYCGPGITPSLIRKEGFVYLSVPGVDIESFAKLAYKKFNAGEIYAAADANPSYLKAAYTTTPKAI